MTSYRIRRLVSSYTAYGLNICKNALYATYSEESLKVYFRKVGYSYLYDAEEPK